MSLNLSEPNLNRCSRDSDLASLCHFQLSPTFQKLFTILYIDAFDIKLASVYSPFGVMGQRAVIYCISIHFHLLLESAFVS